MEKLILLFLCACALSAASRMKSADKPFYSVEEAEIHFEAFIEKFNRNYPSQAEKAKRFEIFKQSLEKINRENMDPLNHATYDITLFADLTQEEFLQKYTGLDTSKQIAGHRVNVSGPITIDLPENFDWRDKNAVTRVKDQGPTCGSCWAFSVTGTVEGAYAIKHNLVELSEQQLVDCDTTNGGCHGGIMTDAIKYLINNGGIMSEKDYPYIKQEGQCKFNTSQVVVKVTELQQYNTKDEEAFRQTLVTDGPISIGVDARHVQLYDGGILNKCECVKLNHGVLLVGYGTENGEPYWTVKNSWGEIFGEKGYFRVKRGVNCCGLMCDPSRAIVE